MREDSEKMRAKYFTFSVKRENLKICLRTLLYGGNLETTQNRAISNVEKGDILWMWNRKKKSFLAHSSH
jgi:hypothetical protein